jgi:putative nucleotidyltransferase with HDIG domain
MISTTRSGRPDYAGCLQIMDRMGMPPHIVRHSQTVCAAALYLTRKLGGRGVELDRDLVRAGALLHDIAKIHSLDRTVDHALIGSKVLRKLGFPDVAAVVRRHVRLEPGRPAGRIGEAEVVNYSDKRVVEDRITTLGDRLDYIRERYARTPEAAARIARFSAVTLQLEKEIFDLAPGGPAQLLDIDIQEEVERA